MKFEENQSNRSKEEAEDLTTGVFPLLFFVDHDTVGGGEDEVTELPGGQDIGLVLLDLINLGVEPGRDDTALVQPTDEVDNDLSLPVVIDDLEIANITLLLHALQELDNDLGGGPDHDLPLTPLFLVDDVVHRISENGAPNHL